MHEDPESRIFDFLGEVPHMDLLILCLEIIGTVSFAISGAMTALKKDMDIFMLMKNHMLYVTLGENIQHLYVK